MSNLEVIGITVDVADFGGQSSDANPQHKPGSVLLQGPSGKSAYELAVAKGYKGTEDEWLASLQAKRNWDSDNW